MFKMCVQYSISSIDGLVLLLSYSGQLSVPRVESCCPAQRRTCINVIVYVNLSKINEIKN